LDEKISNIEFKEGLYYIEQFINSNKEFGIFCEDDIYISKNLPYLLPYICKKFVELELDVLLLGYLLQHKITKGTTEYDETYIDYDNITGLSYHMVGYNVWGTQMYMLSRKQALHIHNTYNLDYAIKTISDKSVTPFSADWTITKDGKRAIIVPIVAIEDNKTTYDHEGQRIYHESCFNAHFESDIFLPLQTDS
jgi:hypothetical protein